MTVTTVAEKINIIKIVDVGNVPTNSLKKIVAKLK